MKATTTGSASTNAIRSTPVLTSKIATRLLMICTITFLFIACKKDKDDPAPPPTEKIFQINFGTSSVAFNLVDSGFVVLKKAGSANQIFKRFEKKTNALSFSIEDLTAGNWTAELYIFARFNASAGRRYDHAQAFTIPTGGAKQNITLAAPTGAVSDIWKPYAFFRHETQEVAVAVALDATDPHFDIQVKDTKWDLYYVERYASNRLEGGANAKVAEQIWACDNNCYTSDKFINNNTAFLPFTQEVGNKPWNNGLIIVVVADNEGADVQFSHVYNK